MRCLSAVSPGARYSGSPATRSDGGAESRVCATWVIYAPLVFSTRGGVIALAVSWLNSNLGRNSRKTTWFPPLGKMRPLPATASQGKSPVPRQGKSDLI